MTEPAPHWGPHLAAYAGSARHLEQHLRDDHDTQGFTGPAALEVHAQLHTHEHAKAHPTDPIPGGRRYQTTCILCDRLVEGDDADGCLGSLQGHLDQDCPKVLRDGADFEAVTKSGIGPGTPALLEHLSRITEEAVYLRVYVDKIAGPVWQVWTGHPLGTGGGRLADGKAVQEVMAEAFDVVLKAIFDGRWEKR